MFYKYKHRYNPKIDFLFLYNLNPNYNNIENFNEIKQIYKKNIIPSSNQGYEFKKIFKLFSYLEKNKNKTFSDFANYINEVLDVDIDFDEFKNTKIKKINFEKSIELLIHISKINKNRKYYFEIGIMILNNSLKINKFVPIVFHHNQIAILKEMVNKKITKDSLVKIIDKLNTKTKHYLNKFKKKSKKQIIKILQKQDVIYDQFNIKKIWLFGSFSHDASTKYSDVDLIVDIEKTNIEKLKEILSKKLKRTVDIHSEKEVDVINKENIQKEKILIYEKKENKK